MASETYWCNSCGNFYCSGDYNADMRKCIPCIKRDEKREEERKLREKKQREREQKTKIIQTMTDLRKERVRQEAIGSIIKLLPFIAIPIILFVLFRVFIGRCTIVAIISILGALVSGGI
jgi:hypothetical protein